MKVFAKEMAFYRGSRVRPGTVLDIPDDARVHFWMHVLKEGEQAPALVPEGPAPIAPSELRRLNAGQLPIGVATASSGVSKKTNTAGAPAKPKAKAKAKDGDE